MKLEPLSAPPQTEIATSPKVEHDRFCEEIAVGLHALAQPLSIVQSAVEMLRLQDGAGVHSQRYLELSTLHIREACQTFHAVQNLLFAEMTDAESAQVDLLELLRPLIEVQLPKFQALGIGLNEPAYATQPTAFCDATRTEQAINGMFEAMLSVCATGDHVEIGMAETRDFVEITMTNPRQAVKPLNARHRLGLALARANVRTQSGRYFETQSPFSVSIALPAHDSSVK